MPKYVVRYESIDYYEKEYEASSYEDAEQMFHEDDKLFESTPHGSSIELIDTEEII